MLIFDYLLVIAGFILLIFGANWLVDGSSGLAKRFNISNLIIGLTVVAFGTSAPEMVVNFVAVLNPGTTDIAFTNIIGSNIINTYVILGLAALVYPIVSQKSSRRFEIPLSLFAPIVVLLLVTDGSLNPANGMVLLVFFVWFMTSIINKAIRFPEGEIQEEYKPMKIWKASLLILFGLAALISGAQLIVPAAQRIAVHMGVSQAIIGLTIVAFGTSLPELATSAVAAFKKNSDIALGNVIGSNIFNIFFVLASSALVRSMPVYAGIRLDLGIAAIGSLLLIIFIYTNKGRNLKRWGGAALLLTYGLYLTYKIISL